MVLQYEHHRKYLVAVAGFVQNQVQERMGSGVDPHQVIPGVRPAHTLGYRMVTFARAETVLVSGTIYQAVIEGGVIHPPIYSAAMYHCWVSASQSL